MPSPVPDWLLPAVAGLLHTTDSDLHSEPLVGGGNNRVFRVSHGESAYLVKWYFAAPDDPRDRLQAEWEFTSFAWCSGLRNVPRPVACDRERKIGVYSFLDGRQLAPGQVAREHVRAAVTFLQELNRRRNSPDAAQLSDASESCFSVAAHAACVQRRVERLRAATSTPVVSAALRDFVEGKLAVAARGVTARIQHDSTQSRLSDQTELPRSARILSPSDFGFHNAVLDAAGQPYFFDFEYAGWDDPAKTICDFFCQVAVPVPCEYWPDFAAGIAEFAGEDAAARAERLWPLYLVKWCCIVLNPLLRSGRDRRVFSGGPDADIGEAECLARAQQMLARIETGKVGP